MNVTCRCLPMHVERCALATASATSLVFGSLAYVKMSGYRNPVSSTPQALVRQVRGDTALLQSKVLGLRGAAGGARFDAALAAANADVQAAVGDAVTSVITV